MTLSKVNPFTKKPTDLPDSPSPLYSAQDIKEHFQTPADELQTAHNQLVDDLEAPTGASALGAKDGETDSTVQAVLNKLSSDKATNDRVLTAENRIAGAEGRLTIAESDIDSLFSKDQSLQSEVNTSKSDITSLKANKADKTEVQAVQSQVNALVVDGDSSPAIAQALAGSEFTTLKQKLDSTDTLLADIVTVKPSGNADTDTANIQSAFNAARVVKFQNKKDMPFLINAPINIEPLDETTTTVSVNGRLLDFNNATFKVVTPITNCFVIKSYAFPKYARNYTVKNIVFDGEVTDSFLLIENSFTAFNTYENIKTGYDAKADSLVRCHNQDPVHQGGLNAFRRLQSMNLVKYTLKFTKAEGANHLFDDLIIEDISTKYLSSENLSGNNNPSVSPGACIYLDTGCTISMSKISRLYLGGYGHIMSGGSGGASTLYNSTVRQLYSEVSSATSYGIGGITLDRCTVDMIRIYRVSTSVTFARCIYATVMSSTVSNLYISDPQNGIADTVYFEELGANSKDNKLSKVGEDNLKRIKLALTDATTTIDGHYNDGYFFVNGGNLASANDNVAKTINLVKIPKVDIHAAQMMRIKVKGETNNNALNVFKIKLTGTGVDIDLLNYVSTTNANVFEVEADIIVPNATNIYVASSGSIGSTAYNNIGAGTPLRGAIVTPDELKVVLNVTSSSYIGIFSVSVEKLNKVLKPLTGAAYAQ